jgi:hypothetical protein
MRRTSTNDPKDVSAEWVDRPWLLGHGIRNLLRCDEAEVVTGIANYVMTQHRVLGAGSSLMEHARGTPLPAVAALLGFMTRFLEVRQPSCREGIAWVARLGNERRAIEKIIAVLPESKWSEARLMRLPDWPSVKMLLSAFKHGPKRILKIAARLHRRHSYFKVLRVLELAGYYTRFVKIFRSGNYQLAVMSSHSNPHGIAFNLAARRTGVPLVLVTHGMPVRPVARLHYDLSLVHCDAAAQTYVDEGCCLGRTLIHGRRQRYRPMPGGTLPARFVAGVFLSKDVNEPLLKRLIRDMLGHPRVARVVIRAHPKNLYRGLDQWLTELNDERVARSRNVNVLEDLEQVDLVTAGNSSVLVDAVTAGKPAVYVPGLDYGAPDMHRFVERGLIAEIAEGLDPEDVLKFYQRPEWRATLRLFANIDEDENDVLEQFVLEMRAKLIHKKARINH